jgi:hypothetical protein
MKRDKNNMKIKQRALCVVLLSIFTLAIISAISVTAYTSDSYSQEVGDTLTWEVTYRADNWTMPALYLADKGDRLRFTITVANATDLEGDFYDTLYADIHSNTATNRTWVLRASNTLITGYNGSEGIYLVPFCLWIIPHNETAVNYFFWYLGSYNYLWTPGLNGYDGHAITWEGPGYGEFNEIRKEFFFNNDGILHQIRAYNGTGIGWNFGYQLDLQVSSSGIPGFEILSTSFSIIAIVGLLILYRRRKPN